jgi:hypothetical protein
MGNENIFTVLVAALTILGSVVGVWVVNRKNTSEIKKAQELSLVKAKNADIEAREAEVKERADLIEMIKESTKQGAIWLEALKIIEANREKDYATLKAIIEDGTQETINSSKELLKGVNNVAEQAVKHNTGLTNILEEVKREIGSLKNVLEKLPGQNDELKRRIDITLGYVERMLPKMRTGEVAAALSPTNDARSEKFANGTVEASENKS